MFFRFVEPVFLLFDGWNNEGYVMRVMTWA